MTEALKLQLVVAFWLCHSRSWVTAQNPIISFFCSTVAANHLGMQLA